jgi:hypothetical protein
VIFAAKITVLLIKGNDKLQTRDALSARLQRGEGASLTG